MMSNKTIFLQILFWQAIRNNYTQVSIDKNIHLYKNEGLKVIG
jgi:hypothetical protein